MSGKDPINPAASVTGNDKAVELVDIVIQWCRGNRNVLSSAQQTTAINAITSILNGTFHI